MRFFMVLGLILSGHSSFGNDSSETAKVFLNAYAQEQAKMYLAEYLNANPEIVFSSNPNIGTQSMKYLGKALAAYGLVNAKNDKDRAFAVAQLVNNNPKVALAILAAQLADTVISIRHSRDLAKRYEVIQQIQHKATKDLTLVYANKYNQQRALVDAFSGSIVEISNLNNLIRKNALYRFHIDECSEHEVTSDAISEAIDLVFRIDASIRGMYDIFQLIKIKVNLVEIGFPEGTIEGWSELVQGHLSHLPKISEIRIAFVNVYKARAAESMLTLADTSLADRRDTLNLYAICVNTANSYLTAVHLKQQSDVDPMFLRSCKEKFKF